MSDKQPYEIDIPDIPDIPYIISAVNFTVVLLIVMPQRSREKATTHSKRRPPQEQPEQEKAPDWPALQPLVPTTHLALETLLEDQIILIRNLFTSTLCKKLVSLLSLLPLTTTPVKPKQGEAIRANDRIQYDDPAFAQQLWRSTALQSLVNGSGGNVDPDGLTYEGAKKLWGGEVCGLNPRIRIYRYGQDLPRLSLFPRASLTLARSGTIFWSALYVSCTF